MAVIDVVSWDNLESAGTNPVFAWKFTTNRVTDKPESAWSNPITAWKLKTNRVEDPDLNLSTFTQLIVRESQEAVLFSKGQILGKFGPGKHTLNTENLPLLRQLYGLPFGGKNPFFAEVWFVNKLIPLNIDWDTSSMMYHDPDYQAMVPIKAVGRYGLRVQDAERFLVKLVGTAGGFTAGSLTDQFSGALNAKTKTSLLSYMQSQRIGIKSISAYLEPLSQALKASMVAFWEDYGFSLEGFYITSVEVDGSHPDGRLIQDAIGRQSAQLIGGYSWQQSKAFEVADTAVASMAEGKGGLLGALMMTSVMGSGGVGGALLQPPQGAIPSSGASGQVGSGVSVPPRDVFCSNCSKKYSNRAKFCPHCGDPYMPCPRCGCDNDKTARRCVECGTQLVPAGICPVCQTPFPPGSTTCLRCARTPGGRVACAKCGSPLSASDAFCAECGTKVD